MLDNISAIELIKQFICCKREEYKESFPNLIIRDDIFGLLERNAIVVYYPLAGNEIDGFNVVRMLNGKKVNFVYINTARELIKQVFTAAHELGHIWKLDEYLISKGIDSQYIKDNEEQLMNRFAAAFLMDSDVFKHDVGEKLLEAERDGKAGKGRIRKNELLSIAAFLMDKYLVPFKAVMQRFIEVGFLMSEAEVDGILESKDDLSTLEEIIHVESYSRLLVPPSKKKSIGDNLAVLVSNCLNDSDVNGHNLSFFCKEFGIPRNDRLSDGGLIDVSGDALKQ